MGIKFFLGLYVSFFLLACNSTPQQKAVQAIPTKVYNEQGIVLKAYDFKALEPMLHQSDDTTYVFNFWATWCEPCVAELPHFEEVNKLYANRKFKMVLVSLDFPKMVTTRLIPFIKNNNLMAEVVYLDDLDANTWVDAINSEWSGAIPATLIYKNDKRYFYEQSFTLETLKTEIEKIIN